MFGDTYIAVVGLLVVPVVWPARLALAGLTVAGVAWPVGLVGGSVGRVGLAGRLY